jgi:hypothetical protein
LLARIPITIAHHYDFGADRDRVGPDLVNPESWDAARETSGPFGLPATRAEWERAAARADLRERARAIAAVADELGARRICSYGVGGALVEHNLILLRPDLELVCTDYTPRALARLGEIFPEAEVRHHDLLAEEPVEADLHLFHRIDSELANKHWQSVLPGFREPVLLVATQLLDLPGLLGELRRRLSRTASRAGYLRTEAALRALWRGSHSDRKVAVGELTGFLLTQRVPSAASQVAGTPRRR